MLKNITPPDFRKSLYICGENVEIDWSKSKEKEIYADVEKGSKRLNKHLKNRKIEEKNNRRRIKGGEAR